MCAAYKTIHLQLALVVTFSADAFLQSLKRFVARHGRPKTIYSDNADGRKRKDLFVPDDWVAVICMCNPAYVEFALVMRISWIFLFSNSIAEENQERIVQKIHEIIKRLQNVMTEPREAGLQ